MKYTRALILGSALLTSGATFASAQAIVPVQWGWQHRDDDDRQAFRDGFQRGRWDAEHRRRSDWDDNCRYREDDDRRAYRTGYERGYREVNVGYGGYYGGDGDHDRDDGYGRGYRDYGRLTVKPMSRATSRDTTEIPGGGNASGSECVGPNVSETQKGRSLLRPFAIDACG